MLKETYGVASFPVDGRTFLYPHAIQHAPHFIWRHWGEFDDSFAVIRHPGDRLLSSLRYRLDWQKKRARPHDSVDAKVQSLLKSNWWVWMKVGGHLVPQHHFVAADTVLFRFEDSWQKQLCDRFGLDLENFPKVNVSKKNEMVFNNKTEVAIRRRYAKDFALFGYE
jgi:hypothetical protein